MDKFEFPESEKVDSRQLQDMRSENQNFLEAKYYGDVAQFRAEVIQRMIGHSAINGRMNWLVYRENSRMESNVLVNDREKNTLIILARLRDEQAPRIKILTNTEYWLDGSVAFMTEDITIDNDGDSQMLIDVVFLDEKGVFLSNPDSDATTQSALFWIDSAGKLSATNVRDYTFMATVTSDNIRADKPEQIFSVLPFGDATNIEDRITALKWAQDLFDETKKAQLVTCGSG